MENERSSQAFADDGRTVAETLVDADMVEAPCEVAEHLGRGRMTWLEALHTIDGEPSIRSQYWLRTELSLYQVRELCSETFGHVQLREIVDAEMYYAWRSFDASAAARRDAALLGVPTSAPLLRRCGVNNDRAGRPLLYVQRDAPTGRVRIILRTHPPEKRLTT